MKGKALYSGAGLAVVAGLLMGAAMKPDLGVARPNGPQIFGEWPAGGPTGPFDTDALAFAAYASKIPDYVLGTDWRQAVAMPVAYQAEAYQPEEPASDYPEYAEAEYTAQSYDYSRPAWEEPAREAPSYPSMAGGVAYGQPVAQDAVAVQVLDEPAPTFDPDAPPEATGDTSVSG
ncbi:hypothetical protein [Phenylobacterium deserti]|uniref:Uncharacterized protein n=1 Tax=Phenylobacterium deserti TaxID=1914756 RepID=A0A328A999_9CAUL|nr:hypothetical protein [Phenylobacterium deserti]RAK51263.1 hypothetical protein DJ018_15050 [Phenylobacterium deserti]